MKLYNWDEVFQETGVTLPRIRYAMKTGRLSLPKTGLGYVITDEGLLTIMRYFKEKPNYFHVKKVDAK